MRIAVLSDIHGNLEALKAVLSAVRRAEAEKILCLGDVVGYGPDPVACLRILNEMGAVSVAGNHDLAVLPESRELRSWFRTDARIVLDWTEARLEDEGFSHLRSLPVNLAGPWGLACHGSVGNPLAYIVTPAEASEALRAAESEGPALGTAERPITLLWVGHTHLPLVVHVSSEGTGLSLELRTPPWEYGKPFSVTPGRWLINPGSVGQPRDMDPRSRWALFDSDLLEATLFAEEYDYRSTQDKMLAASLPIGLVLALGARPDPW